MKHDIRVRGFVIGAAVALAVIGWNAPARAEPGVECGTMERPGSTFLHITVTSPGGTVTRTATIEIVWGGYGTMTGEDKAEIFRLSVPDEYRDKIALSGTGADVLATGLNGWRINGVNVDNDETNEPDRLLSYVTPTDGLALCSLSGMATGQAASGGQGLFKLAVAGRMVQVPTFPGMPAQIVEQQVFGQLLGMGVEVHYATPEELALLDTVPTDGMVLAISGLDPEGMYEHLQDTGLIVDVAGLVRPVPPLPPADPLASIAGTEPDGSFLSFGSGVVPPLPAGFFGPGSDPFEGRVLLGGEAIDESTLGDASTLIQRTGAPFDRWEGIGATTTIPIELVALNLVSCTPITVTYDGGQFPEPWHVGVSLSVMPAPAGQMESRKTFENGGTFSTSFYVRPRFTFTRLSDHMMVDLDSGLAGMPPLLFTADDGHWVHDVNPALQVIAPSGGSFVPGVEQVDAGDIYSQELRRLGAHEASGAARFTVFPARAAGTTAAPMPPIGLQLRCYPNPFNARTQIEYTVPATANVSIRIYDLQGVLVKNLFNAVVDGGTDFVTWNGTDEQGAPVASGLYISAVTALDRTASTKVMLVK